VSDHRREESSAPKARIGRLAFVIVGVAVAAVIIEAAARSWTIDRPSIVQVVICVALLAARAIWFWTWCAIEGVRMGTGGRLAGNVNIKDTAQREVGAPSNDRSATFHGLSAVHASCHRLNVRGLRGPPAVTCRPSQRDRRSVLTSLDPDDQIATTAANPVGWTQLLRA
jgi:hypothetical protein